MVAHFVVGVKVSSQLTPSFYANHFSSQNNLLAYVGNLKKSKDMYDKLVGMYEVNNLNEMISLKDQIKDMKMNKGESMQSYIMRISCLRDHLQRVGETMPNKELVVVTLRGLLPPIWETFITTLSNNNNFLSFDETVEKLTQEESRIISRGKIQKHEGEPAAFVTDNKKKKGK